MFSRYSILTGRVARGLVILLACLVLTGSPSSAVPLTQASVQDHGGFDPADIWDLAEIQDTSTLDAEVVAGPTRAVTLGVKLEVAQVMFNSIDRGGGPIRVHAFVAMPEKRSTGLRPAIIYGHGSGDEADEEIARELAAMLSAVAVSFSGPGQGLSTGPPSTARNWLNTIPAIRDSWLYQYVYSAMRAVTYVATLPEVDPERIAMTGISAGGLMTLIANGVDDRLAAAYPIMAAGDWFLSVEAGSWFLDFPLGDTGLGVESPEVVTFEQFLDPIHYADRQQAPVMLVNGSQDEFFPITTTRSTYLALRAPEKRLEVVYDWDHGYYASSSGLFDTYDNTLNAARRIFGDLKAWFAWQVRDGDPLPPDPQVSAAVKDGETLFTVAPEFARHASTVRLVTSRDGAYTFSRVRMKRRLNGTYSATLPGDLTDLVYFVEVQLRPSVFLTSVPVMPDGFIPRIRPPQ